MAVLRTSDYTRLTGHLVQIDEIFNDALETAMGDAFGLQLYANKMNSNRADTVQLNHGLAGVGLIPEGSNFPEASGSEGDSITYTKAKYGSNVIVTKEARLYDEYDQVKMNIETIVDEGINKLDQSLAEILQYGWSTSYTDVYNQAVTSTGPDGLALFSASHTNGTTSTTFGNIITDGTNTNPVLGGNRDAVLNTRAAGLKYTDPNGVTRPIKFDTILVGPTLEDAAMRLINSDLIPGSANNDTNQVLKGRYNVVVWDKLDATFQSTDTSAYRYMYDSKKIDNTLKVFFSQEPRLSPPQEFDPNRNWNYLFDFLYSRGFSWAPYIRGSKGDNS